MKGWNLDIFNVRAILLCVIVVPNIWATPVLKFPSKSDEPQLPKLSSNIWKQKNLDFLITTNGSSYNNSSSPMITNSTQTDTYTLEKMKDPIYISKPDLKVDKKEDKVLIKGLRIIHPFKNQKSKENARYFALTPEDFHKITNSAGFNYNNIRSKRRGRFPLKRKNLKSFSLNDLKGLEEFKDAIFLDLETNDEVFTNKSRIKTVTEYSVSSTTTVDNYEENGRNNEVESSTVEQEGPLTSSEASISLSDEVGVDVLSTSLETSISVSEEIEMETSSTSSVELIGRSDELEIEASSTTSEMSISASDEVEIEASSTTSESSASASGEAGMEALSTSSDLAEEQELENTSTSSYSEEVTTADLIDTETTEPEETMTDSDFIEDNTSSSTDEPDLNSMSSESTSSTSSPSESIESISLNRPTRVFIDLVDSPSLFSDQPPLASTPNPTHLNQVESDAMGLKNWTENPTPVPPGTLRRFATTVPPSSGNSTNRVVYVFVYMDLPSASSTNLTDPAGTIKSNPMSIKSSRTLESHNLFDMPRSQERRNSSTSLVDGDVHQEITPGNSTTETSRVESQKVVNSAVNSEEYFAETSISSTASSSDLGPVAQSISNKNKNQILSTSSPIRSNRVSNALLGMYSREDITLSSKNLKTVLNDKLTSTPTLLEVQKVKGQGRRMHGSKLGPYLKIPKKMQMSKKTPIVNRQELRTLFRSPPFPRTPSPKIQQIGRSLTGEDTSSKVATKYLKPVQTSISSGRRVLKPVILSTPDLSRISNHVNGQRNVKISKSKSTKHRRKPTMSSQSRKSHRIHSHKGRQIGRSSLRKDTLSNKTKHPLQLRASTSSASGVIETSFTAKTDSPPVWIVAKATNDSKSNPAGIRSMPKVKTTTEKPVWISVKRSRASSTTLPIDESSTTKSATTDLPPGWIVIKKMSDLKTILESLTMSTSFSDSDRSSSLSKGEVQTEKPIWISVKRSNASATILTTDKPLEKISIDPEFDFVTNSSTTELPPVWIVIKANTKLHKIASTSESTSTSSPDSEESSSISKPETTTEKPVWISVKRAKPTSTISSIDESSETSFIDPEPDSAKNSDETVYINIQGDDYSDLVDDTFSSSTLTNVDEKISTEISDDEIHASRSSETLEGDYDSTPNSIEDLNNEVETSTSYDDAISSTTSIRIDKISNLKPKVKVDMNFPIEIFNQSIPPDYVDDPYFFDYYQEYKLRGSFNDHCCG